MEIWEKIMLHKPRILIVSPGVEDSGSRGLGRVTVSLIDSLKDLGFDAFLLTGALIPDSRKRVRIQLQRKYLGYYLNDGLRFISSKIRFRQKAILIIKDSLLLVTSRPTTVINEDILSNQSEPVAIRRFANLKGYVNLTFFYQFCKKFPISIRSIIIRRVAKSIGADIIITASPFAIRNNKHNKDLKIIQYIHDLMPLNMLETPIDSGIWFANEMIEAVDSADLVISSSKNAKNKLQQIMPRINTKVVYLNCEFGELEKIKNSEIIVGESISIRGDYMLFMSALEKRKNVVRLIKAYQLIANDTKVKLVIAGSKGYGWDEIEACLQTLDKKTRKKIIIAGYVDENEKMQLIARASMIVHPAIDEGLGIPVIEGMLARLPVVATRLESLYEFIDESSVVLIDDPYNVFEISDKIKYALKNLSKLNDMANKNYDQVFNIFSKDSFEARLKQAFEIVKLK